MPTKLNSAELNSVDENLANSETPETVDNTSIHISFVNENTYESESPEQTNNISTPTSPTCIHVNNVNDASQGCVDCKMKDELIEKKSEQIKLLQEKLRKCQRKVWYLENVKKKLTTTLLGLKRISLVNEDLLKVLKVSSFIFNFDMLQP